MWVNDVVSCFNRVDKSNIVLLKEKYSPSRNFVCRCDVFVCMEVCVYLLYVHVYMFIQLSFLILEIVCRTFSYHDHCVPEPHNSKRIYLARKYKCITQIHNMDKHTAISVPDVI